MAYQLAVNREKEIAFHVVTIVQLLILETNVKNGMILSYCIVSYLRTLNFCGLSSKVYRLKVANQDVLVVCIRHQATMDFLIALTLYFTCQFYTLKTLKHRSKKVPFIFDRVWGLKCTCNPFYFTTDRSKVGLLLLFHKFSLIFSLRVLTLAFLRIYIHVVLILNLVLKVIDMK